MRETIIFCDDQDITPKIACKGVLSPTKAFVAWMPHSKREIVVLTQNTEKISISGKVSIK